MQEDKKKEEEEEKQHKEHEEQEEQVESTEPLNEQLAICRDGMKLYVDGPEERGVTLVWAEGPPERTGGVNGKICKTKRTMTIT